MPHQNIFRRRIKTSREAKIARGLSPLARCDPPTIPYTYSLHLLPRQMSATLGAKRLRGRLLSPASTPPVRRPRQRPLPNQRTRRTSATPLLKTPDSSTNTLTILLASTTLAGNEVDQLLPAVRLEGDLREVEKGLNLLTQFH